MFCYRSGGLDSELLFLQEHFKALLYKYTE